MTRFSIIIPVYNVRQYLRDCLDSVLAQTCTDWEAVCVNDGSTDDSLSILREYAAKDKRIRIIDQPNGGAGTARNAGIHIAQGEYIFFLDADDWIVPDALERLSNHLYGQDLLCFSGQKYMEADGTYHQPDVLQPATYSSGMDYYNANALLSRDFQFVCIVLRAYKTSLIRNHNLYFREKLSAFEDDLWVPQVCFAARQVAVIPDNLYVYRIRPNSVMTSFSDRKLLDLLRITNQLAEEFSLKEVDNKVILYRSIAHHFQKVLALCPIHMRSEIKQLLNWHLYRTVSRTKLRHRYNYIKYRLKYLFA